MKTPALSADSGKRKKSNCDIQSLECCFSSNNAPQIACCGLARCPDEGYMRHSSTNLISFVAHVHGGSSNIFIINPIDSLTFRHPMNVDSPSLPNRYRKNYCFEFSLVHVLFSTLGDWGLFQCMDCCLVCGSYFKNPSFETRNYVFGRNQDVSCSLQHSALFRRRSSDTRSASNTDHGQTNRPSLVFVIEVARNE